MKNLFTAFILAIALAGVSLAQSSKPRIAVIEFTPGPNASAMTAEAKRHLQASIANSIHSTRAFEVVDVRNTRAATQDSLPAINGEGSTSTAVRVGKLLGVNYVLTGSVVEYNTKVGQATVRTRFIEVATGKVKYSGETTQQSTTPMSARAGEPEMMTKVLKPFIQKLTATLTGADR